MESVMSTRITGLHFQDDRTTTVVAFTHSFSMFNLMAGEGGEFRTRDTAQDFPFLSPDAVSSLSDLVCTLIGDMHDTIGVSMQQVARTDTHTGDHHFTADVHTDGVAMGDDKPGTEVLESAKCTDFPDIEQATIRENTNGSKLLHARRHNLTGWQE